MTIPSPSTPAGGSVLLELEAGTQVRHGLGRETQLPAFHPGRQSQSNKTRIPDQPAEAGLAIR